MVDNEASCKICRWGMISPAGPFRMLVSRRTHVSHMSLQSNTKFFHSIMLLTFETRA